jgi:hypothetical protein
MESQPDGRLHVTTPQGIPGRWKTTIDITGATIASWPATEEGAANETRGVIADEGETLVLGTSGAYGNFAGVESPWYVRHGCLESRLWVAGDRAGRILNWPAFWLLGDDWPRNGECDLFEADRGTDSSSYWRGPADGHVSGPTTGPSFSGGGYSGHQVPVHAPGCGPGWNTVAVDWEPGKMVIYKNGRLYTTFTGILDAPMKVIFNITQGDNGLPQARPVPSVLKVAYLRHWAPA